MNSNAEQNPNQSSDQSYRPKRRPNRQWSESNGHHMSHYQNDGNYYPNSGYYSYNANNQWSDCQPMSRFPNYRQFANYSQNYNNFDSNESQNNSQSFQNNNGLNQHKTHYRRHQRQQKRENPNTNEDNSRTNETNVEFETQRSADNSHRVDSVLSNTSNDYSSQSNVNRNSNNYRNSNNRREKSSIYKKESVDENGKKGFQRSYDRNYGKRFDRNETNFRDYSDRYENKRVERVETNDKSNKSKAIPESDESQREIMEDMLRKGEFECMVCCDGIKIRDHVWNCEHCYNVFHLKCIKMWANSQSAQSQSSDQNQSWRCPACQTHHRRMPTRYQCFCGKVRDPELNRYLVPHSCGEMCGRKRKMDPNRKYNCNHKCLLLCHPGSCPPCQTKITRECGCGRTKIVVNCATSDEDVVCDKVCNKALKCGQHFCKNVCHSDKCSECPLIITQKCFCGQNERQVECNVENNLLDNYCCQQKCNKTLNCGNHLCEQICHSGDCNECPLDPNFVTHCSCGKTKLEYLTKTKRQSCTDPIPSCDQICDKELICGPEKELHQCRSKCHSGSCPPCPLKTIIRCRCGANSDNIECIKLNESEFKTFICKKRCNKKRVCARHKCLNECCIDGQHICEQVCGKRLSCGLHTCEELCHNTTCPQCWNISWDELTCRCGNAVKLPPIACGTKRPECGLKCSRFHPCDHPIDHNCHDDNECPPCTYFTPKVCFGGHEKRPVPCYETGFSCGFLCGKPLDCGLHECQMICHSGDCNECTLPCNKTREECEHLCGLKCHQKTSLDEKCPKSNCKQMIKVFCDCGRKTELMPCFKVNNENSLRISMNALANQRLKNGESVNITEIIKNMKDFKLIQLKCDEKCAVIERNRQLAEALDIKDADFSPEPGPPKYSDLLKNGARTDPTFMNNVYESLKKLVMESKQSKLSFKNFSFPPMNSENRHIIHEMAEHFGCKTHAVDREPNRSVVVKAAKDKCYLPTVSLMDFIKEELESRKTIANKSNKITLKNYCFDTEKNGTTAQQNSKPIDYFDFKGE